MKLRLFAVAAAVASVLLGARPAAALTFTVNEDPVVVGQPKRFVATVDGAVGIAKATWQFGDDPAETSPLLDITHTFNKVDHVNVSVTVTDDVETTHPLSFIQTVHNPITPIAPRSSSSILLDEAHGEVWTVNPDDDSVSVINVALDRGATAEAFAHAGARQFPVGDEPHSLAQAPDGTIWVASQMSDEVVVLDRSTGDALAHIALPYASQPLSIVFGPTSGMAYVSLFATGQLLEIDPGSREIKRRVSLGPTPAGIAVASDGRIFVTRFISPDDHGEVWVVSPNTFALSKTITLAFDPGRPTAERPDPDGDSFGRGVPNYVASITISPDGTVAWVGAKKDDVARGQQRPGKQPMTPDNFVRNAVCSIDMAQETERLENRLDVDDFSFAAGVLFSPVGDLGYILLEANNGVQIYDVYSGLGKGGITMLGNAPDGLALAANGTLFVHSFLSREVIAHDLNPSLTSLDHGEHTPLAHIPTIGTEILSEDTLLAREKLTASEEVLLGKQIFFNAFDKKMDSVGYMSCVSCHFGGMSDGRVWDFTDRGEGLRNTRAFLGARGVGEGRVHWTANMNEIQDFERDIRESLAGQGFMPDAEFEARKTGPNGAFDTFGMPSAGVSKELDGLAAYFATFDKAPRSPYRNPDGSFTEAAVEGRKIFSGRAGCNVCHSGPDFTDSSLDPNAPLHDVGTILATSGTRLFGALTGFDTPTLKGLWQSAPYLHDGRAATLRDVFAITQDHMGTTSGLSETEMGQLVEYLLELDDVPETAAPEPEPAPRGCAVHCTVGRTSRSAGGAGLVAALFLLPAMAVSRRRSSSRKPTRPARPQIGGL